MSLTTRDPEVIAPVHARQRVLLRRLMIRCPEAGHPTDTGFELSSMPPLMHAEQLLVDCLEYGQDHAWRIEDAFLDR